MKVEELTSRFVQLQNDAENLKPYIRDVVEKYRHSVDEQYDKVYASIANAMAAVLRGAGSE